MTMIDKTRSEDAFEDTSDWHVYVPDSTSHDRLVEKIRAARVGRVPALCFRGQTIRVVARSTARALLKRKLQTRRHCGMRRTRSARSPSLAPGASDEPPPRSGVVGDAS